MQVDPVKPMLKAPGIKLLKLRYDETLSNFAFNIDLRRYTTAAVFNGTEQLEAHTYTLQAGAYTGSHFRST